MGRYWITITMAIASAFFMFFSGVYMRGLQCDADMADFRDSLSQKSQDQRDLKAKVEASQTATTQQSSQRLDQQQVTQQQEVVYVEKEVVRYRDRWRDRACARPVEWVQLYNDSLFGPTSAVPETR